jgi:predicted HAD superfamily phosphohydrolase
VGPHLHSGLTHRGPSSFLNGFPNQETTETTVDIEIKEVTETRREVLVTFAPEDIAKEIVRIAHMEQTGR